MPRKRDFFKCGKPDWTYLYFYVALVVSLSLIGVSCALLFTPLDDPCMKNSAYGGIGTVLTFWANPPKMKAKEEPPPPKELDQVVIVT